MTELNSIGIFEVKTHLSELLKKVQHGETFIITSRGEPIAQLKAYQRDNHRTQKTLSRLREIRSQISGPVDIKEYIEAGRKY